MPARLPRSPDAYKACNCRARKVKYEQWIKGKDDALANIPLYHASCDNIDEPQPGEIAECHETVNSLEDSLVDAREELVQKFAESQVGCPPLNDPKRPKYPDSIKPFTFPPYREPKEPKRR